ncbi:hypothetical protein L6452_17579 [Arctium lappa]|uniref:Uncharacterized protein n=1 Tax=Arctium lappa TaxID=4217 RepID=A0ACB9C3Z8_ARCLA|nr:hypothetical protein L6452_17579 [Arctium lappa]
MDVYMMEVYWKPFYEILKLGFPLKILDPFRFLQMDMLVLDIFVVFLVLNMFYFFGVESFSFCGVCSKDSCLIYVNEVEGDNIGILTNEFQRCRLRNNESRSFTYNLEAVGLVALLKVQSNPFSQFHLKSSLIENLFKLHGEIVFPAKGERLECESSLLSIESCIKISSNSTFFREKKIQNTEMDGFEHTQPELGDDEEEHAEEEEYDEEDLMHNNE